MFFSHPVLLRVSLACGATQFVTYAILNFTTLFLMREKGMTLNEIAVYYALLVGGGIGAGMYVSGRLIDRLAPRSKAAYGYLPAAALALAIPFFVGFVWAPDWPVALAFLALPTFLNYFYLSPAVALVQEEVRPDQRVLAGALLLLVMNLIGLGLGPALSPGRHGRHRSVARQGQGDAVRTRDHVPRAAARHVQVPVQQHLLRQRDADRRVAGDNAAVGRGGFAASSDSRRS